MGHGERLEDGWWLSVSVMQPVADRPWTVSASLGKRFRPPPGYTYDASYHISQFDRHLGQCHDAWEQLQRAHAAKELGISFSQMVHGFFVSEYGVRAEARGGGKFRTNFTLFADAAGYRRHRAFIERARDRAEEVAHAFVKLGEIPDDVDWRLDA